MGEECSSRVIQKETGKQGEKLKNSVGERGRQKLPRGAQKKAEGECWGEGAHRR